ncbi:hypothetical protein [Simiduia agarivorans]|uniref:Uncharacterized protein n=1 Tax=Simiduia agarivorans (strain DSM 21679 / JCM 13881 / BCRC 17597 / SA1) TaxID=1117647 RepID=K4KJW3_SIMAS|nr:hypothetical protein [Simiduia agarivorans]AFU98520.1 hypothetical protein M5M_06625 [Simiduia agarivorans SA1 = DSM 21679]
MLTTISATRIRLRAPKYPVNGVLPYSWLASKVSIEAAGNIIEFTAPPHYPMTPGANRAIQAKRDVVEHGRSYDVPKAGTPPIIESWRSFFRTWAFNAPWWGGTVAQLSLMVEIVKPKRLKESADLLSYPALKYAIEEYIEANYHHIYVNNERINMYSKPDNWAVGSTKNSPYISLSMLRQGEHIRHILKFIPLNKEYFVCFCFVLDRQGRATDEQEIEKQIPAAPMIKLINGIMSSVEIQRKGVDDPESGFSEHRFIEEAKANPLASSDSGSVSLMAS